ncbi:uncharacterized protein MONOS_17498 [Monocercomonoides exilis]|uniref:uncharacterized protein n=1 Tax=Monocercomonoides exilis TaxID=2049356 RepID=UPI003559D952|nr:hypothetical protein MONOS_17498 [Monocercomonoides exilis]
MLTLQICVPYLLKIALRKDESKEAQKEVEMALLALSNAGWDVSVKTECDIDELVEIIKYNCKHRNLTYLANQSAWSLYVYMLNNGRDVTVSFESEKCLTKEIINELEELEKCVDWRQSEKKTKQTKEAIVLIRWAETIERYFQLEELRGKEYVELADCITRICKKAKENQSEIYLAFIRVFEAIIAKQSLAFAYDIIKREAADIVLEELMRNIFEEKLTNSSLFFIEKLVRKLKGKKDKEIVELFKSIKRELFTNLEEEAHFLLIKVVASTGPSNCIYII